MEESPTVFVVDDDRAVCKSLDMLLRSVGIPVETYSSAQEFLDGCDLNRPGCLVLDVRMAGMSGLELQRLLKEKGVPLPVIVVTGHGDVPIAVRAMKDGAMEFLEKPFSKDLLLEHIRVALARSVRLREERQRRAEVAAKLALLTHREREVMDLVVAGRVSKQIAAELAISKKTVDVHRARVMKKLRVDSVPALVELALSAHRYESQAIAS